MTITCTSILAFNCNIAKQTGKEFEMYFLANDEKGVFGGVSPTGRILFDKFSALDDAIQVQIFVTEIEAVNCGNYIIQEYKIPVSVHPLSELETYLKGV